MAKSTLDVAEFGKVFVYNEHGDAVRLSELWQDTTAALILIRHFGWILCRQQVAELARHQDSFSRKNCALAVIGSGAHTKIAGFKKITAYGGIVLTDPSRKVFELLGLSSSIGGLFGMKTVARGLSALRKGFTPGSLQGSALQLGGAVIVDQDSSVRYLFQSSEAGEDAPVEEMIAALE